MKVLLYNDTYQHLGGAETYCLELLSHLPQMGHEIYWLAHGEQEPTASNHMVIPHFNEGKLNYFCSKYFFNQKAYLAIKEKLEEIKPDVVHLHHDRYYTFSVAKALKDLQIPVIQTIHDYTMLCPSQYYPDLYYDTPGTKNRKDNCQLICSQGTCLPLKSRIGHPFAHDRKRKIVQNNIQTFVAPSTKLKEYLELAGFKNVHFIPFFVDEKQWSFDSSRNVKNKILFVGRIETNKGIYHLINAVKTLKKEIQDIQLMIAGTGSQFVPIQEKIKIENLDSFIQLAGFVDYQEIGQYYENANVLVVPSLDMEQFGLIGIEGLASGTAVIGSDTGGIPEWCIHEKTGLLFNPDNPSELTQNIRRMLLEKGLSEQLTQQGMQHLKNTYNIQQHFNKLLQVYKNAKPLK